MQPFPRTFPRAFFACALPVLVFASGLAGCRKAVAPPPKAVKQAPPRISDADLAKWKPNEAGAIMVLMYHRIRDGEASGELNRPPAEFKRDLETLLKNNYYPVNASDIVENKLDVPAGKTPVALTFDDSLPTQFRIVTGRDGKPHIDPNCAVGIMESFSKAHPKEWPTRATFFVLPKEGRNGEPFGEADSVGDKFAYLIDKGYEIANHTSTHSSLRSMKADKIQWELATARRAITKMLPPEEKHGTAPMQILALPYGKLPRDKTAQAALMQGTNGGTSYRHRAVFLAAWRPILSPVTRNDKKFTDAGQMCPFDPQRLERVKPDAKNADEPGTFEYWMKWFQKNPSSRYISDGNPKVCAIPVARQSSVDALRVEASGQILQAYGGGASSKGKGGTGSLSVE